MKKLQPVPLGVAVGVLWAIYVFFAGIIAMTGWSLALVRDLASLYLGYGPSLGGALIGAIWAFADGLIAGAVIAWIYNALAR